MRAKTKLASSPLMRAYLNVRRAMRIGDSSCLTRKDLMAIHDVLVSLVMMESYALDHSIPESIFGSGGYREAKIHRIYLKHLTETLDGVNSD